MFTSSDVEGMCGLYPQYRCMASHLFSLHLPWESTELGIQAVAFVRDPVERALSFYFYGFQLSQKFEGHAEREDIESHFDKVLSNEEKVKYSDGQLTFLSRYNHDSMPLSYIEDLVKSGRLILAPSERFDDACLLLESLFPDDVKDMSYYSRVNSSSWARDIPESVREKISENNLKDLSLHGLAERFFEDLFDKTFPEESTLRLKREQFESRCRKRKWHDLRDKLGRRVKAKIDRIIPG